MDVIQRIFNDHFEDVRDHLCLDQLKAADSIIACRTAKAGGRVHYCPTKNSDHDFRIMYNSCHYRYCPQCNLLPRLRWLEKAESRILNCAHRQVVFTVPHELNELWRYNKREINQLLFKCASKCLKTFLADDKWLGAKAGFSLVLHTWGRNLSIHPHIHAVITEGGITPEGKWKAPCHKDFLPAVPMMHKFRGAYLSGIRELLREDELTLPPKETRAGLRKALNALYQHKKWNVKVEPGYLHGRGVVKYLSRYLKGGPIRSRQVKRNSDGVRLRYKDHRSGLLRYQRFTTSRFIQQLLCHAPPLGMPVIRHYGLYASGCKESRDKMAEMLPKWTSTFSIEGYLESIGIQILANCSVCGCKLEKKRLEASEQN